MKISLFTFFPNSLFITPSLSPLIYLSDYAWDAKLQGEVVHLTKLCNYYIKLIFTWISLMNEKWIRTLLHVCNNGDKGRRARLQCKVASIVWWAVTQLGLYAAAGQWWGHNSTWSAKINDAYSVSIKEAKYALRKVAPDGYISPRLS